MWNRPELLNRVADLLVTLAALLAGYGALIHVAHLPVFPLREIRVTNPVTHVTREQIETIVRRELRGNFFTLRLPEARTAFEKLPWVRKAHVRRHWPDRLDVVIEEQQPLARWGNLALVNTKGEVFHAAYDGELPVFVGPAGSAKEVAIQFIFFRRQLAVIGRTVVQVQVTPRRAWQVRLDGGPTLELGRDQVEARLARFVATYGRTLEPLRRRVDYVDLRYGNGYAVRIPELKHDKAQPARAQRS